MKTLIKAIITMALIMTATLSAISTAFAAPTTITVTYDFTKPSESKAATPTAAPKATVTPQPTTTPKPRTIDQSKWTQNTKLDPDTLAYAIEQAKADIFWLDAVEDIGENQYERWNEEKGKYTVTIRNKRINYYRIPIDIQRELCIITDQGDRIVLDDDPNYGGGSDFIINEYGKKMWIDYPELNVFTSVPLNAPLDFWQDKEKEWQLKAVYEYNSIKQKPVGLNPKWKEDFPEVEFPEGGAWKKSDKYSKDEGSYTVIVSNWYETQRMINCIYEYSYYNPRMWKDNVVGGTYATKVQIGIEEGSQTMFPYKEGEIAKIVTNDWSNKRLVIYAYDVYDSEGFQYTEYRLRATNTEK